MYRRSTILLLLLLTAAGANVRAQQADKKPAKKAPVKIFAPDVYLGRTDYRWGPLAKTLVDTLLKQNITSRDSSGKTYKVISFDFTYAERKLYEDSVGNLMIIPDYLHEHCDGDTLTGDIKNNLFSRTKAGDTVYFDNVLVVRFKGKTNKPMPDSTAFLAKGMKFEITK